MCDTLEWREDYVEVDIYFFSIFKDLTLVDVSSFIFFYFFSLLSSFCFALHRCTEVRVELWFSVLLEINGKALVTLNLNGLLAMYVYVFVCSCSCPCNV